MPARINGLLSTEEVPSAESGGGGGAKAEKHLRVIPVWTKFEVKTMVMQAGQTSGTIVSWITRGISYYLWISRKRLARALVLFYKHLSSRLLFTK